MKPNSRSKLPTSAPSAPAVEADPTGNPCNWPLITIGITCFNAGGTIVRALASALDQAWPNKEIIVVDDCSEDFSFSQIELFARANQNVRVLRPSMNVGVAACRNIILKEARGEFLAYFDDDDESYPQRLTLQYERLTSYEKDNHCRLVFCSGTRNICVNGEFVGYGSALGSAAPEPHGEMVAHFFLGLEVHRHYSWGLFGTCTLFARTTVMKQFGGFDPIFRRCAEWDLAVRTALEGAHFVAVREPIVTQHKTATADKAGKIPLRYAILLREKHASYLRARRAYWASICHAHAKHYGNTGHLWKSRIYAQLGASLAHFRKQ